MVAEGPITPAEENLECPECGAQLILKESRYGKFYGCETWHDTKCPGSIGAHPDGRPLGRLANQQTKRARQRAHVVFNKLWEVAGLTRKQAYAWMRREMGLSKEEGHIAMFDTAQCEQLIKLLEPYRLGDEPDMVGTCSNCSGSPVVPLTGLCGPCTFGAV